MKIILIIAAILIIGGGVFLLLSNRRTSQSETGPNVIFIQNMTFMSENTTVKAGDSVTWTNNDSTAHTATADDNSWDTGTLNSGQSKSITFNKAGTYSYHCGFHGYMKGTVIVN